MARVRIKHPDPKLKLLRILFEHLIYATKIIPTPDSYMTLTPLKEGGLDPIMPPELRAKRIIILFNVDNFILSHPEAEIKEEMLNNNNWLIGSIESVFKIPKTKIIKICLKETAMAKMATDRGMLAFHMSISSHNIKIQDFIPIFTCMRCYSLEDHTTNNCPFPNDHTVCSECSSSEHTWKNCNSDKKKCLNCSGAHRTLANKCPKRKEIKENKRKTQALTAKQ
ncbi:hypothetical protein E2C01_060946 [Portunus trituberculatus]|uniref:Nucleic-acid-binding protein from transposon X-element n=1 Tax=Portunus trituberculatus TaxID=210409 RepID=A0A5B7H9G4_PORTR|nr:hypothetical protein [Portunus trituberculatus]